MVKLGKEQPKLVEIDSVFMTPFWARGISFWEYTGDPHDITKKGNNGCAKH
jgi:hypothetical protein